MRKRFLLSSHSVVSDSLWPHGLQHVKFLCPSQSPRVSSNSCPLSLWCHSTISSCRPLLLPCLLLLLPSIFISIRVFSSESALCVRWPKYWSFSFSISPSSEDSGLISFRMDWFRICGPCPLPAWFTEGFYCGMLRVHIFRTLVVCQKYLSGRFMSRSSSFWWRADSSSLAFPHVDGVFSVELRALGQGLVAKHFLLFVCLFV